MALTLFLIFGLMVGGIASITFPETRLHGWIASMAIGVVGAVFGGMLGQELFVQDSPSTATILLSLLCAALLVTPYHLIAGAYVAE